jgi:two-component system cell cycle sensor histidine kinase PleC
VFFHVRYLCIVISIILAIATMLISRSMYNYAIEEVIYSTIKDQASSIANVYIDTIWKRYEGVVKTSIGHNQKNISPQLYSLIAANESFFKNLRLLQAEIYDINGDNIFRFKQLGDIQNQLKIYGLETINSLSSSIFYISDKSIFSVAIPLKVQENAPHAALLVLSYDITQNAHSLGLLIALMGSIICIAILIVSTNIIVITIKLEKFLEKEQEKAIEIVAEKAAAEAESQEKSKFLANMSHELRTPLNAIIGFSQLIASESLGPVGDPQYKEFSKDINTSGEHLLSLINDILDYSKAEDNKLDIKLEDINLTKLTQSVLRLVSPRAQSSGVKLESTQTPSDKHIIVKADAKRMKQVLLNLLTNAIKFTQEGGLISITTKQFDVKNAVVIEIKDNGVGMAPQDLARALSPFHQVENKMTQKVEGTGLGLTLSKTLVELMKGEFEIKSEVGLGTIVTLKFHSLQTIVN